jgi:hypothetical protein
MDSLQKYLQRKEKEKAELSALGIETSHSFPKGINYLKMPANPMKPEDDSMEKWNQVIGWLRDHGYRNDRLVFTKSKGLSKSQPRMGYVVRDRKSYFEIVAVTIGGAFRVTFTANFDIVNEGGLTGREAFQLMKREFRKDGIDLADYATDKGLAIKEHEIEKPYISVTSSCKPGETYEHVHHLDLHSAYPSGLVAAHPEFRPTIQRVYENRKKSDNDKKLKLALDASIGYMQSEYCSINRQHYALANLSRDGINWCNSKIRELTKELMRQGYRALAYNTDGIWYAKFQEGKTIPSEPMHCSLEGDCLGTYANDHLDCKARWKSKGSYEFVENGKYKPVVRGSTKLDKIKSRDEWEWGDIFQQAAEVISYRLEDEMLIKQGD